MARSQHGLHIVTEVKEKSFLYESLLIVMMYVTEIFVTVCLVEQIMNEIQLMVQGWKTHHIMSSWAQRLPMYCVQVWLGLLFNWLPCVTLHHQSIVAVCNAKNAMGYSHLDLEKKWTQ